MLRNLELEDTYTTSKYLSEEFRKGG